MAVGFLHRVVSCGTGAAKGSSTEQLTPYERRTGGGVRILADRTRSFEPFHRSLCQQSLICDVALATSFWKGQQQHT